MMTTCDNCGSVVQTAVKVAHLPTFLESRDTNEACAPCARAMVRAMPLVWAIIPERKN